MGSGGTAQLGTSGDPFMDEQWWMSAHGDVPLCTPIDGGTFGDSGGLRADLGALGGGSLLADPTTHLQPPSYAHR